MAARGRLAFKCTRFCLSLQNWQQQIWVCHEHIRVHKSCVLSWEMLVKGKTLKFPLPMQVNVNSLSPPMVCNYNLIGISMGWKACKSKKVSNWWEFSSNLTGCLCCLSPAWFLILLNRIICCHWKRLFQPFVSMPNRNREDLIKSIL